MPLRLAIGTSDFRKVRESGAYYVDKTSLIRDLLDAPAEVVLLPRPRRFGKTMNLSMLRAFLERSDEDLGPLFRDLEISAAGEAYQPPPALPGHSPDPQGRQSLVLRRLPQGPRQRARRRAVAARPAGPGGWWRPSLPYIRPRSGRSLPTRRPPPWQRQCAARN